jgi:hypothetical protein
VTRTIAVHKKIECGKKSGGRQRLEDVKNNTTRCDRPRVKGVSTAKRRVTLSLRLSR